MRPAAAGVPPAGKKGMCGAAGPSHPPLPRGAATARAPASPCAPRTRAGRPGGSATPAIARRRPTADGRPSVRRIRLRACLRDPTPTPARGRYTLGRVVPL